MIAGIGNDLIEIARIQKIIKDGPGKKFLERILTPAEQRLAEDRKGRLYEFAAGRFAAKEAVVKALGCGICEQIGFQDVEILPDSTGKPLCTITEAALNRLQLDPQHVRIHLSITHTAVLASAYVVIESL
jgi:holo-[acyl-carrier protein] synthase